MATPSYVINFTDSSKTPFVVPEYKLEGPINPLSLTLAPGTYGASTAHTSLLLVGRGVPNYGEIVQENLVHMLENFASNGVPPAYQTTGQLWFDISTATLRLCTNSTGSGTWEGLLKTTGGTMSGDLVMSDGNTVTGLPLPTQPTDATPLAFVQNHMSLYLPITGGNLTGVLTLSADPTAQLGAATKQYVDSGLNTKSNIIHNHDATYMTRSGDTMSGPLTLNANPSSDLHAATKQYVDNTMSVSRVLVTSVGQTVFSTPPYVVGSNKLWVFVQGVKAYEGSSESYTEDSPTQITFTYTIPAGTKVEFIVFGA